MTDLDDRLETADPLPADELRRQALTEWEKRLQESGPLSLSQPGIRDIVHELQIHQIELEMQNDELRRVQEELDESRARYFDLFDLAPVGYCTISEKGLILEANLTVAEMLGVERSVLVKQPVSHFIVKESQDVYYLHRKKLFKTGKPQSCEIRMVKQDGPSFWVNLDTTAEQDNDGVTLERITLSDITLRKREEAELLFVKEALDAANEKLQIALTRQKELSNTDAITGLCNRRHFFEIAANEFYAAVRYQHPLTILLFDVDEFKHVNDTLGHEAGDKALEHVGLAAAGQLRKIDLLARYGGDEFIILLPQTSALDAFPVAERIRESIAAHSIVIDQAVFSVTTSIGIAEMRHPQDGEKIASIIKRADTAMYAAKAMGRNHTSIYSE